MKFYMCPNKVLNFNKLTPVKFIVFSVTKSHHATSVCETRMGAGAKIDLEKVTKIRVLLLSSFSIGYKTSSRSTDHVYLSTNP